MSRLVADVVVSLALEQSAASKPTHDPFVTRDWLWMEIRAARLRIVGFALAVLLSALITISRRAGKSVAGADRHVKQQRGSVLGIKLAACSLAILGGSVLAGTGTGWTATGNLGHGNTAGQSPPCNTVQTYSGATPSEVLQTFVSNANACQSDTYNYVITSCPTPSDSLATSQVCSFDGYHRWDSGVDHYSTTIYRRINERMLALDSQPCRTCRGDPIFPLQGTLQEEIRTGLVLRGMELKFTYDSSLGLRPATGTNPGVFVEPTVVGPVWRSSFHRKLQVSSDARNALISMGDGTVLTFSGDGTGSFVPEGHQANTLAAISGGYRFWNIDKGEIDTFDASGNLLGIATIGGATLTFTYSGGNLIAAQADDGRSIRFAYSNNLLSTVTGPANETLTLAYDNHTNLATLTWPDAKSRHFLYENAAVPWALTGIVDENDARETTFGYDAAGRAISTERAGGAEKFIATYGAPPAWTVTDSVDGVSGALIRTHAWTAPQGVTVTGPNGQSESMVAQAVRGVPLLTSLSQSAASGSGAGVQGRSYDARGNLASVNDFAGSRKCYAFDAWNREVTRIEGLTGTTDCASVLAAGAELPAGARKTRTAWHPDWKLPTEVVEPMRVTSFIYNGQADPFNGNATATCATAAAMPDGKPLPTLCKQVTRALLPDGSIDGSVPAQVKTFTYDNAGRVLTRTDAANRTSTYAYYADTVFSPDPPAPTDDAFKSVVLLVHGDASRDSTQPPTWRVSGNVGSGTAPLCNTVQSFDGSTPAAALQAFLDAANVCQSASYTYTITSCPTPSDTNVMSQVCSFRGNHHWDSGYDTYSTTVSWRIPDRSGAGHTVQAIGDAGMSTGQSKFGSSAMSFDGAGDYLNFANSSDFSLGSGDFTIEFWVWTDPRVTAWARLLENVAYNVTGGWHFSYNGNDAPGGRRLGFQIGLNGGGGARIDSNAALPTSQWAHVAVTRSAGVIRMFVNGVLQSASISTSENYSSQQLRVGSTVGTPGNFFMGYLEDLRITKGVARYTSSFSAPTAAFPDRSSGVSSYLDAGHTVGDPQSESDPAGHSRTFNLFDPSGRPRRVTDAKGVVHDFQYTPRGWLSATGVTAQGQSPRTTTYSYDSAGQMTGVSQPDGTSLGFSYDAAHRLTGVSDARGNSITYTLDASGNRTGEDIKDASGVLRRSIARSFDALNRVQQVTGAAQ